MRVIVAHDFADNFRAFAVWAIRRQTHIAHAVENATVDRLEPVSYVGQRAANDHTHCVVDVRAPHLIFDVDGNQIPPRWRCWGYWRYRRCGVVCH